MLSNGSPELEMFDSHLELTASGAAYNYAESPVEQELG